MLHPLPGAIVTDLRYVCLVNTKASSDNAIGFASSDESANLFHIAAGELRVDGVVTEQSATVILRSAYLLKVIWIDAAADPAEMVKIHSRGNLSEASTVNGPVGSCHRSLGVNHSVTRAGIDVPLPDPAGG
jgi:hypothetical protein